VVSLKDIAGEMGVSVSLVSKVLSGRLGNTGARPDLARAIRERARERGYRRNNAAVALREGRQGVIAVFIHRHGKPGSGIVESVLQGISSAATTAGLKLLLDFFPDAAGFRAALRSVHPGLVDGLIVGGVAHRELRGDLRAQQRAGIRVVTLLDAALDPAIANVGVDQEEVGRLATGHLVAQGCRRIGHIVDMESRFAGYRRALRQAGLPYRAERVHREDRPEFSYARGQRAVRAFLARGVALDGLVAQSDEEALGALHAFADAGRRVPGDVKVIGVDDAPYCAFGSVPLSSVSQNCVRLGEAAVGAMRDQLAGRRARSVMLKPTLCPRRSTSAAP
jgi:DNA-binding LacI/PurR family transcriptional regulator